MLIMETIVECKSLEKIGPNTNLTKCKKCEKWKTRQILIRLEDSKGRQSYICPQCFTLDDWDTQEVERNIKLEDSNGKKLQSTKPPYE